MADDPARRIVSRRSRPAKAALSRELIVTTALTVLETDGLARLSLRRVATALDTGAASLYVYLANLDELYAHMLDEAFSSLRPPVGADRPWRDRLKDFMSCYLSVLNERPGLANLAMSTVATGPNSLRMLEVLLGLLKEGGVDDVESIAGADLLLLHVTAIAAEDSNRQAVGQDGNRVMNALASASADQFPLVSALANRDLFGESENDDARFKWTLDVIIDGILANKSAIRRKALSR